MPQLDPPRMCANCSVRHPAVYEYPTMHAITSTHLQRNVGSMLAQCWFSIFDAEPTLVQHWISITCQFTRHRIDQLWALSIIVCN